MSFPEWNGPKTMLLFFSCVSIETSLNSSLWAAPTASDALVCADSDRQQSGDLAAEQCRALALLREQEGDRGVAVGPVGRNLAVGRRLQQIANLGPLCQEQEPLSLWCAKRSSVRCLKLGAVHLWAFDSISFSCMESRFVYKTSQIGPIKPFNWLSFFF